MSEGSNGLPVITPEDFDLVAVAGRGAFGTVWVVRKKHDYSGRIMAMKALSKQDMMEREYVEHTVLEKEIMAVISDHPFCVSLFFTFQTETHLYIVMEYLPGGHLLSYVMDTDEPWADDKAAFYGGQTILALEHMHKNNVVYRDLKLENILLDMDGNIRLTDFGLSALLKNSGDRVHSMSGTAAYIAPEVLDPDAGHSFSADVWSFGVMMFILLLHESPFYSENTNELFEMIRDQDIDWDDYADELSPAAMSLLQGLLTKKVEDRLGCGSEGISALRSHPFFQELDWEALDKMEAKPFIRPRLRVAERATPEDFRKEMNASKAVEGEDPFGGFSFVAADYMDTFMLKDEPSLGTVTEAEESVCWPFPVKVLPISLVFEIIGYLGVEDVARASRVCKDWNTLLWSRLWRMDFSTVDSAVFAKYWTSRICPLLSKPDKLRSLTLNPGLKDAGVSKLPQIISLEMLSLKGCTNLSPHAIQRLHRTVQNLGFTFSKKDKKKEKEKESPFGTQRFPFLSHLSLEGCTNLGDGGIEHVASCGSLTSLDLSGVTTMTGMQYLKLLKKLEVLVLAGIENITDVGLLHLHNCRSLREVELGGTSVTEDGIGALRVAVSGINVKMSDWTNCEDDQGKKKSKKKQKFGLNFMREVSLSKKPKRGHKRSRSVEVPNGIFEEISNVEKAAKKDKKTKKTDSGSGVPLDSSTDSLKRKEKKKHKAKSKKDGPESPEKAAGGKLNPNTGVVSPRSPRDGEKKHRTKKEKKPAVVDDLGALASQLSPREPEEGRKSARRRAKEKRRTESLRLESPPPLDGDAEADRLAVQDQEAELRELQALAAKQKKEKAAAAEAERQATEPAGSEKVARERSAKEKAERAREKAEKAAKAEKEKAEKERAEKEKEEAEKEKAAKEKAAKEKAEKEKAEKEKAEREKAEKAARAAKAAEEKARAEKEKEERAAKAAAEAEKAEKQRQEEQRLAEEAEEKLRKANDMQQKLKKQIKSTAAAEPEVVPGQARSLWHQREKAASAASLNTVTGKPININRTVAKKVVPKSTAAKTAGKAPGAATSTVTAPKAAAAPKTAAAAKAAAGSKAAAKPAVKRTAFEEPAKPAVIKPVVRDDTPKSEEEAILLRSRAKRNRSKAAERTGARRSVSDIASIFARQQQQQQPSQPPQ